MPASTIAPDAVGVVRAALELHRVRAAALHELDGGGHGLLDRDLVAAEGEVGDDEGVRRAAHHGAGEDQQLLGGHRHGGVVAEHGVAGGVADEQDGHARLVEDPRRVHVVGREHRPPLAARLHLLEVVHAGAATLRGSGTG